MDLTAFSATLTRAAGLPGSGWHARLVLDTTRTAEARAQSQRPRHEAARHANRNAQHRTILSWPVPAARAIWTTGPRIFPTRRKRLNRRRSTPPPRCWSSRRRSPSRAARDADRLSRPLARVLRLVNRMLAIARSFSPVAAARDALRDVASDRRAVSVESGRPSRGGYPSRRVVAAPRLRRGYSVEGETEDFDRRRGERASPRRRSRRSISS